MSYSIDVNGRSVAAVMGEGSCSFCYHLHTQVHIRCALIFHDLDGRFQLLHLESLLNTITIAQLLVLRHHFRTLIGCFELLHSMAIPGQIQRLERTTAT